MNLGFRKEYGLLEDRLTSHWYELRLDHNPVACWTTGMSPSAASSNSEQSNAQRSNAQRSNAQRSNDDSSIDTPAARHWRTQLEAWAIPDVIRAAAVSFPYEMDPNLFRASAADPVGAAGSTQPLRSPSLSTQRALDVLTAADRSSVIDVGCGGGAATMAVADRLHSAVGVDQSSAMLDAFAEEASTRGISCRTVEGTWPATAGEAGTADLVLCHHVAYNVANLAPFVLALDHAAGRRVVMELTLAHPQTANAPLWRQFWDLDRPTGPTADEALAVVHEAGIEATLEIGPAGSLRRQASIESRAVTAARMLCLGPDRLPEVEAAVRALPQRSGDRAVIWWDLD